MVVRSLQMLAGLGTSAEGQDMPGWVLTIYEVLHLFSGDYSFIKPDCVSPVPFEQMFGVSIAYSIGVFVPVWIGLAIASQVGPRRARADPEAVPPIDLETAQRQSREFWNDRSVRMLVIWGAVMYLPVTALGLETLSCNSIGGGRYQMITRPHEPCYVGNHMIITAAASVLLAAYTLGFPLLMLRWVKKKENEESLHFDERFMERWNFLYEFYNFENPTFWLIEFPISIVVAAGKSALKPHVNYQMGISCAVFLYKLVYICLRRPFIDWVTDVIQAVLSVVSLVAINMTFFSRLGVFENLPVLSLSFGITVIVLIAVVIVGLIVVIAVLLLMSPKEREAKRKSALEGRDGGGAAHGDGGDDANIAAAIAGISADSDLWGGATGQTGEEVANDEDSELSFVSRVSGFFTGIFGGGAFGDDGTAMAAGAAPGQVHPPSNTTGHGQIALEIETDDDNATGMTAMTTATTGSQVPLNV
jgi:uncharacterized membrane protein